VPAAGVDFPAAVRLVLGNPRFRIFIGGFALLWLGLSMVNLSMALVVTVLMGLPRGSVGAVLGAGVGATLLAMPLVTVAAHRFGTHRTLVVALSLTVVVLPLLAGVGRWPVPLSPVVQGYTIVVLAGPSLAALFTLPNTLLADLAHTTGAGRGPRIEGMFFAFQGLILNTATSAASLLLGGLLEWLGYELGLRAAPLVAAMFVLAGIVAFRRYPMAAAGGSGVAAEV
jgi:Na+/melibiose symporter-like transporter